MTDLRSLFEKALPGDTLRIAPGEYVWDGEIPLKSGIRVEAEGAIFRFPETLPEAHVKMFTGEDICDFSWHGGTFTGHVYDPARLENPWAPNVQSAAIVINGGRNLTFLNLCGENLAGPVIYVSGSEEIPALNVTVKGLVTSECGKFMWDYGYLWQRITFPEFHAAAEVENAYRFMPDAYYSDTLAFDGDKITSARLPERQPQDDAVTFFGEALPPEIVKGRYYYAEEAGGALLVRERLSDDPIRFTPGNYNFRLFRGIYQVYHAMFAPSGSGSTKGSLDLRFADGISVCDCRISAPGDATHFHHCKNGEIFANHLKGARMGAMFLSSGCENVKVRENIVNGNNGSRVLTVETGGTGILIENNIFLGGGRGTWIDTPHGITLRGNLFTCNTCKATPDPKIGRISPTAGTFERFAEIYFTTRQYGATYGGIVFEGNRIETGKGSTAALVFNAGGRDIRVEGNTFAGESRGIYLSPDCSDVWIEGNLGGPEPCDSIAAESFDIPGTIYLPGGMRK